MRVWLAALHKLPDLRVIDVRGAKVTSAGIAALRKAFPKLQIIGLTGFEVGSQSTAHEVTRAWLRAATALMRTASSNYAS